MCGYVTHDDYHESNTRATLKEVMAALKASEKCVLELSDDVYDEVERLLYKYQIFVRQDVRQNKATHKGVSWYLTDAPGGRSLISYQDGPRAEWLNDCFADEVPLWLLRTLFRRIKQRKPLGDQDADDIIKRVGDLDAAFVRTPPNLVNQPRYASYVEDADD